MTRTTHSPVVAAKKGVRRTAWLTTLSAVLTNLAIFSLARAAGVEFEFATSDPAQPTRAVAAGMVVGTTVVTMAIGWALAGLAARYQRPSLATMALVGGIFAALSAFASLPLDATTSAKLALASLHLTTAAFYIGGIASLRPSAGETR